MATQAWTADASVRKFGTAALLLSVAMEGADTSQVKEDGGYADRSFQVNGTWGSATLVFEGSNDGTTYVTLKDSTGAAMSFTADALVQIGQITRHFRVRTTGGTGTALVATLFARQNSGMV